MYVLSGSDLGFFCIVQRRSGNTEFSNAVNDLLVLLVQVRSSNSVFGKR